MGENMCKWSAWQGIESESEVAQSYLTLSDPMDCSLPGSSAHGIFQARVLEWGAIAFSREWYWYLVISIRARSTEPSGVFSGYWSRCISWRKINWSLICLRKLMIIEYLFCARQCLEFLHILSHVINSQIFCLFQSSSGVCRGWFQDLHFPH